MNRPWRSRAAGLLCALLLLSLFVGTSDDTPSVDAASASLQGWRIATSGEPWLEDVDLGQLEYSYTTPPLGIRATDAGHDVVHASPGVTSISVLAYLAADDAPGAFRIRPASILAAVLTWLAVLMMYAALRSRLGVRAAGSTCLVLALGTPVWSVAADAIWPHTLTIFGISGMAWAASRERWLLSGVLGGVGLCGRLHMAAAVAVFGVANGLHRRSYRQVFLVAAGSLPFLGLAAMWSRWLYGDWDPAGGYSQVDAYVGVAAERSLLDTATNLAGLLVSPNKGILVWTPVLLLLLPAVVRSWADQPPWAKSLLYGGATYTVIQGLMSYFAGGSAFYGYRLTLELLVSLVPVFAFALTFAGRAARTLLPLVAGLQIGAIGVGAAFNSPGLPLEESWSGNAFATILSGVPALVAPWLLCGVLGVVAARLLRDRALGPRP